MKLELFDRFFEKYPNITDYGLDGPGNESRWGRDFPSFQTVPGTHPASCTVVTGSFSGVKCGRSVLLTTQLFLSIFQGLYFRGANNCETCRMSGRLLWRQKQPEDTLRPHSDLGLGGGGGVSRENTTQHHLQQEEDWINVRKSGDTKMWKGKLDRTVAAGGLCRPLARQIEWHWPNWFSNPQHMWWLLQLR
jgi:hypothetical protein